MGEVALERAEPGEGSLTTARTCAALTAGGRPCRALPLSGEPYCLFHSQEAETQKMLAASRRMGGLTRMASLKVVSLPDPDFTSHEGIAAWRSRVVAAVRDGLCDPVRAGVFLAAARDAEERLERAQKEGPAAARPSVDGHSLADLSDEELERIASGEAPRPGSHAPDPPMLTRPYANPLPEFCTDSPPEAAASPEGGGGTQAIEGAARVTGGPQIATSEAIPEPAPESELRRLPGEGPVYPEGAIRHSDNRGWTLLSGGDDGRLYHGD
jgi:hypothetical protein